MASLAIPPLEPRPNPDREALLARLLPLPHSPESMDGIPYYDEEFAMAQSDAHRRNIYSLGGLLDRVAAVGNSGDSVSLSERGPKSLKTLCLWCALTRKPARPLVAAAGRR